jgi:Ankyrin repeats (many copies)
LGCRERIRCAYGVSFEGRFPGHALNGPGMNAMHLACSFGRDALLKMLLDDGRINPNALSSHGDSVMFCAVSNDNGQCLAVLLEDTRMDINDAIYGNGDNVWSNVELIK